MSEFLRIREAVDLFGFTLSSIYRAVKAGRLRYIKEGGIMMVRKDDLMDKSRMGPPWARFKVDGKLVYDISNGVVSVPLASKTVGVSYRRLYYGISQGLLPATRVGKAWVLRLEDVERFKAKYVPKIERKRTGRRGNKTK